MAVDYEIDPFALLLTHPGDPTGRTPLIGYIRVSTAREDMISPEIQADHIDRLAKSTGHRIVWWVVDLDRSGQTLARRQISEVIDRIAAGTAPEGAKVVGVWKFSRWGRNDADNSLNLARLEEVAGGELLSATEQVDAKTAIGRFTRGMLLGLGVLEGDMIAENWKDAQAYRLKKGLPHDGAPRWGYIRRGRIQVARGVWVNDPDHPEEVYDLDPEYRPHYRRALTEAADGRSGNHIVKWLNRGGILTPAGRVGAWGHSTLWDVLDSGFGAGFIRVHDPDCPTCPKRKRERGKRCKNMLWVEGSQPHVFDSDEERDDVWDRYRKRRRESTKVPPRSREAAYDLTGVVLCGWCGRRQTSHAYTTKAGEARLRWRCPAKDTGACETPNSVADHLILPVVTDLLGREADRLTRVVEEAGEHTVTVAPAAPRRERVQTLQEQIRQAQAALDRASGQVARGIIPESAYVRTRDQLTSEEASARKELAELLAEPAEPEPADYVPVIRSLLDEWETVPVWSRNRILRDLVEVRVWRSSRVDGYAVVRTAWGVEERVQI
ncbi:recombinase family protein, partial [Nocardiopsis tropica]|uniref:recombinase family protein n=1 Tax=Nocardiopsis tropica TaxID=109330 RepID=UPI0031E08F14